MPVPVPVPCPCSIEESSTDTGRADIEEIKNPLHSTGTQDQPLSPEASMAPALGHPVCLLLMCLVLPTLCVHPASAVRQEGDADAGRHTTEWAHASLKSKAPHSAQAAVAGGTRILASRAGQDSSQQVQGMKQEGGRMLQSRGNTRGGGGQKEEKPEPNITNSVTMVPGKAPKSLSTSQIMIIGVIGAIAGFFVAGAACS